MGMYNKINSSQAGVVRKLFDYSIFVSGREVEVTRVAVNPDIWGNEDRAALSLGTINAVINFPPGELPVLRFRETGGTEQVANTSLFFYDVLPIEAYFQFKDRVEKGDIYYFTIDDEGNNKLPVLLEIMDLSGGFSTSLLYRKFICAPVTSLNKLPEEARARVMEKIAS